MGAADDSSPMVQAMTTPRRVHITHEFKADPQTVFEKLAEHENLGSLFGAKITRVSDGDTLWIRPHGGGRPVKLRVQGIDAPERCQPWGEASRERLRELVLGRSVRVVEGPHHGVGVVQRGVVHHGQLEPWTGL